MQQVDHLSCIARLNRRVKLGDKIIVLSDCHIVFSGEPFTFHAWEEGCPHELFGCFGFDILSAGSVQLRSESVYEFTSSHVRLLP